jgi:hypothetical protein
LLAAKIIGVAISRHRFVRRQAICGPFKASIR